MNGKFLTIAELGDRWRVSKQTIYNRVSVGKDMPRSVRVGLRRLFPLEEVERWEEERIEDTRVAA